MRVMMLRWRIFQLHYIKEGDGQLWLKRGRAENRHIRHRQEQGQDGDDHVREKGNDTKFSTTRVVLLLE